MLKFPASESDVRAAYRLILGRNPAPGEGVGRAGAECTALLRDMLFSDEFVARRLYDLREPLLTGFTDRLAPAFAPYRAALRRFRRGQKLSADSADNAEFLTVAYLVLLRRMPDPMGFAQYWRSLERGDLDRAAALRSIRDSGEASANGGTGRFFENGEEHAPPEEIALPDPDRSEATEAGAAQLLIVSGPPRSGTTVLAAVLNAHPQICITYESRIFSLPAQLTRSLFVLSPARSGLFDPVFELAEQHAPDLVRRNLARLRKYRLIVDRAARQVYRLRQGVEPPLFVGDKNPAYLAEAAWPAVATARAFPDAKWLLIFRSPGDVCRSQLRLGMAASKAEACASLRRCLVNASELTRALGPTRCFVTTHERLFAAPSYEAEAERLASFLNLGDHGIFSDFIARHLHAPDAYSRGRQPKAARVTREEVAEFFADQPDRAHLLALVAELKLWNFGGSTSGA